MLFILRFIDLPSKQAIRQQFLQMHLDWLAERRQQIKIAGSLREAGSELAIGALWIVEAENADAVRAVFQTDPFWQQGLRASFEIHSWSKAFPELVAL